MGKCVVQDMRMELITSCVYEILLFIFILVHKFSRSCPFTERLERISTVLGMIRVVFSEAPRDPSDSNV